MPTPNMKGLSKKERLEVIGLAAQFDCGFTAACEILRLRKLLESPFERYTK